ncbi:uncharacterized protein N7498_001575 [Penicillium cinerascens]|uniref:Uncharacterized protein n=1 Tax=Penicillium cinerascens TaxID=70096 RepID=A0A9W9NGK3_9EURO|nr:uncharacterized protein N7498_001575 [Penicillium cinerascens]KAJ5219476.1 hypothetical protein N7498_001575 [Penicillium cinerascens]
MTVQARRSSAAYSKPSPYRAHDTDIEKQHLNAAPNFTISIAAMTLSPSPIPTKALVTPQLLTHPQAAGVSDTATQLSSRQNRPLGRGFPFLNRYNGGITNLVSRQDNVPEYPGSGMEGMPDPMEEKVEDKQLNKRDMTPSMSSSVLTHIRNIASSEYIKKYGEKRECFLDKDRTVRVPPLQSYPGVPKGFPEPVMGSNAMLGIRDDVCFDRFGRLGPYGLGYGAKKGGIGAGLEGHRDGAGAGLGRHSPANRHRFNELPEPRLNRFVSMPVGNPGVTVQESEDTYKSKPKVGSDRLPRTAVVIRTWHDFNYTPEDIMYMRSVISELSLMSGGEYTIHFLIHVKNNDLQIWSDDETYQRVLHDALPEEFRGMGTLWSEAQMALMYPALEETFMRGLPIHGVYRSTYMPLQYFAFQHPEYDYFWNWEMDARYTGHWYHLFDKVSDWARAQPRKGLWERNSRFYVPSVHGSWDDFRQMVRVQTESGTNSPNNMWSVVKPDGTEKDRDMNGLHQQGDKSSINGVWGEDADLIVFNPLYDPEGTTWLLRDDVTGYNKENGMPPRRTAIITASRLSRKLLTTMHKETALRHHSMFSEMWPATTALHHGFKAVYVPHAVYIDRRWPTKYLETVFNAGRNGASGGARTSVFGDREHNFKGTTWFYSAGFSP